MANAPEQFDDVAEQTRFGPERPLRLLLVEDSPIDARLTQESLLSSHVGPYCDITQVETLADAAEELRAGSVDCVLLDLGLPDERGPENVSRLREVVKEPTIVVMTGHDNDQIALQALQMGAQEYVVKGQVEGDALARIIRHAIERNRLLRELKELREREWFLATHDSLTSLPNRQLFEDRGSQILARARREDEPVVIAYFDLDGFKPVNDSYGHSVGDTLLREIGLSIAGAVREGDSVARVGGDEFVALLYPVASRDEARQIVTRIIERVRAIETVDGYAVSVSASAGIAVFPEDGNDLYELMQHADIAMYRSKRHGSGGYEFFRPEMLGELSDRQSLIEEIEQGLRKDRFVPEYQAWFDASSGAIGGVEALMRWHTEDGEVRHPRMFLQFAAETGQILKIGQAVFEQALRDWRRWRGDGTVAGHLALNVCTRELRDDQHLEQLGILIRQEELDPAEIELHLDALAVGERLPRELEREVARVRDVGVRVAVEHVNARDVEEAQLDAVAPDTLRLDPAIVGGLVGVDAPEAKAQIGRWVKYAGQHGMRVVAMGVESQAIYDAVKSLGCDALQGFHLATPRRASELPSHLARHANLSSVG